MTQLVNQPQNLTAGTSRDSASKRPGGSTPNPVRNSIPNPAGNLATETAPRVISAGRADAREGCSPAARVTKSLLGYGVIAGPIYLTVTLTHTSTREGFDPTLHPWSLLSNGDREWIQTSNFILTGLMVIAFVVGIRRSLAGPMRLALNTKGQQHSRVMPRSTRFFSPGRLPSDAPTP
jgi:hypothetical protein